MFLGGYASQKVRRHSLNSKYCLPVRHSRHSLTALDTGEAAKSSLQLFPLLSNAQEAKALAHDSVAAAGRGFSSGFLSVIAWCNQARAMAHSRLIVAGDRFMTSAVSSMVSPPK
jgi:hypothetical protein